MGYKADVTATDLTNVTVVGHRASATASNQVRIGNTAVTSIGGKVGWSTLSDGRFKKNLKEEVPGLSFIAKLRPVVYTMDIEALYKALNADKSLSSAEEEAAKQAASKEVLSGFVAQEVEQAAKELNYEFSGVDNPKNDKDLYGLRYAEFVVPLVKAVQEQQQQIDEQKKQIEEQQQQISELKEMLTKLMNGGSVNGSSISLAYLEQAVPNPSGNGTALIRYFLPQNSGIAMLLIMDMKGAMVKTMALNSKGKGQVSINTSALAAGTYTYSLWIEGVNVDSKHLVIVR